MRPRRLGDRFVRVVSYLLVAGSLFVALATGDRGRWGEVIQVMVACSALSLLPITDALLLSRLKEVTP